MLKYILTFIPKILIGLAIFWVIAFIIERATEVKIEKKPMYWKNYDKTKSNDILHYNYDNGTVEYREYGPPPPPTKLKPVKRNKQDSFQEYIYDNIEHAVDYAY